LDEEQIEINDKIQEDILQYGKKYKDEAQRIVQDLPNLPSKYVSGKIPKQGEELMVLLEEYMNELISFSPLIANLIYVRNFLTCNKKDFESGSFQTDQIL
jgi:hypothetical protein